IWRILPKLNEAGLSCKKLSVIRLSHLHMSSQPPRLNHLSENMVEQPSHHLIRRKCSSGRIAKKRVFSFSLINISDEILHTISVFHLMKWLYGTQLLRNLN